jgi:GTPase
VEEGRGEAMYRIGVMDDGHPMGLVKEDLEESLSTLSAIARPLKFTTVVLETFDGSSANRRCATVQVRKEVSSAMNEKDCKVYQEVRVAIVGPYDSGKSSIAGYLTRGVTDDGKGKAGRCVAVHKHEIRHGRTSSFSTHHMPVTFASTSEGLAVKGVENVFSDFELNHHGKNNLAPAKLVSLLDTGGHPKSLNSCLRGISGLHPSCFMLCMDFETSRGGCPERFALAVDFTRVVKQLGVNMFVVITKVDFDHELTVSMESLKLISDNLILVDSHNVASVAKEFSQRSLSVPCFLVSTVKSHGMECLSKFLNTIKVVEEDEAQDQVHASVEEEPEVANGVLGISREYILSTEQDVLEEVEEDLFGDGIADEKLDGVVEKIIVTGVVRAASFRVNQTVYVGPDRDSGNYARALIVSMRCASNVSVSVADKGTTVSMCLKFFDCDDGRCFARRGAVVCARPDEIEPKLFRQFKVRLLGAEDVGVTVRKNEEVLLYVGVAAQAARIIEVEGKELMLEFVFRPEYLIGDKAIMKKVNNQMLVAEVMRT